MTDIHQLKRAVGYWRPFNHHSDTGIQRSLGNKAVPNSLVNLDTLDIVTQGVDAFPRKISTREVINARPGSHVRELLSPHGHVDGSVSYNPVLPVDHIFNIPVRITML